jgi:hypothetical protein
LYFPVLIDNEAPGNLITSFNPNKSHDWYEATNSAKKMAIIGIPRENPEAEKEDTIQPRTEATPNKRRRQN